MAERATGTYVLDTNYDLSIRKPLDARSLVPAYESLTLKSNWLNDAGKIIAYNGMIVAVANTDDASKNGLYFLFDPDCTSKLKSPDVENVANWIKVGETSDIGDFTTRLTKIETELDSIKDRLDALEEKGSDVETWGYRALFPETGEANKLYVAADEGKTYIWFNDEYMSVGGDSEQPEIIFGGTAD